jgi:hypothetical protein
MHDSEWVSSELVSSGRKAVTGQPMHDGEWVSSGRKAVTGQPMHDSEWGGKSLHDS